MPFIHKARKSCWPTLIYHGQNSTKAANLYEEYELDAGEYLELCAWHDRGANVNVLANRCFVWFRKVQDL